MREIAGIFAALLALSCGGSGTPDPPAKTGTFSEIYGELFPMATHAKCDFCHSQPASNISNGNLHVGPDGDPETAYMTLLAGTSTSKFCSGKPYIVPGDPEGSLFYTKVTGQPPCGERMPLGNGSLTAAQIEQIRSWIAAGAPDD